MTASKSTRQFGLWDSPISPKSLAADKRLSEVQWDSDGRTLVWLEGRSDRGVLVLQEIGGDAPRDLTSDVSVRAEVGYGGGDFTVQGGSVYFIADRTGRIYRQPLKEGSAQPITPAFGKAASPVVSPDGRWVAYVHHDEQQVDRIAVVESQGAHWPRIFATGHDFYMQPCWSPDGRRFAWIAWNHPQMPWDGTLLHVASVVEDSIGLPRLTDVQVIAGGPETAIFQPQFAGPDRLVYVSDETGWGRVAVHELNSGERRWLTPEGTEFAMPAWRQGMRTLAVADNNTLIASGCRNGFDSLMRIDLATGESTPIPALAEYSDAAQITATPIGGRIALIGSGPNIPPRIIVHDIRGGETHVIARASGETLPRSALSRCEAVSWRSAGGEIAHGLFYPPASNRFDGPGKPPLIALIHGGPTSQVKAGWRAEAQFFATRGYAVLFVNYRGGTGYGREYMLKLRSNWGICDVEDAISGAQFRSDAGRIDPRRTVIMGGSAGGFTVLQTMAKHPQAFTAGISLFGVANQFGLATDTHKFESRYLDSILGPLPEAAAIYRDRSPIFHAGNIRRPLAVFQGDIDKVVPREQSDMIVEALKRNGVEHVYHVYEGEGHGWRKRETIEHFYQAVDDFLRRHVIFN